jgi:proteic killer suppression protein
MIISFVHKGLEKFYLTGSKAGIQATHEFRLCLILSNLDVAETTDDLNLPGLALHPLKGDKRGLWSVKVSGNWRVIFVFSGKNAELVDYLDYH